MVYPKRPLGAEISSTGTEKAKNRELFPFFQKPFIDFQYPVESGSGFIIIICCS